MPLREHVYCVAVAFKMTEQVKQRICIKFSVKREHSFVETNQMIQKATAVGNQWLAGSSWQRVCSCSMSFMQSFFAKHQITQVTQPCYSPDLVPCGFSLPKTKITFEKEEISDHWWDSEKYSKAANGDWETCVRSQDACFEGDWGITVLCTMLLVSCIFFNECLYFSCYVTGYILDSPCNIWQMEECAKFSVLKL